MTVVMMVVRMRMMMLMMMMMMMMVVMMMIAAVSYMEVVHLINHTYLGRCAYDECIEGHGLPRCHLLCGGR